MLQEMHEMASKTRLLVIMRVVGKSPETTPVDPSPARGPGGDISASSKLDIRSKVVMLGIPFLQRISRSPSSDPRVLISDCKWSPTRSPATCPPTRHPRSDHCDSLWTYHRRHP